ncbi:MAG: NADH-quinone oxidoreductase subunit C [Candidatus Aminicenantales bacterium]
MTDIEIIEKAKSLLGDKALEVANPAVRRIFIKVDPGSLVAAVTALRDQMGLRYLVTISGVDDKEDFELLYHFADDHACINLRTRVPKTAPRIESISHIIPGAILYERELQDMFGLVVERIPDPRPLVVPDDWPAENYPLRKDWKFERPEEKIPGGKS